MLSIFEGMKKQIGADWDDVSLTVIPTKEDKLLTSRCAKVKDVMMAEPTPDNIRITIGNSHVFAHPSYSLESQPMNCIQAASAGNIIVAPKHSGFVEACGDYGLLVPHSFVASVYGMAFAAVLLEAVKVSRDAESFSSLVTVQKHQVDFKYGKERAAMAWNELEGMLDLKA
jgi:glycosyltransferase involved in cell wall biosynthesis